MNETQPPTPAPVPPATSPAWQRPRKPLDNQLRVGAVWVVFALTTLSAVVAFQGLFSALETWLEYQYEPVARAVVATALAAVGILLMLRLTRRP